MARALGIVRVLVLVFFSFLFMILALATFLFPPISAVFKALANKFSDMAAED